MIETNSKPYPPTYIIVAMIWGIAIAVSLVIALIDYLIGNESATSNAASGFLPPMIVGQYLAAQRGVYMPKIKRWTVVAMYMASTFAVLLTLLTADRLFLEDQLLGLRAVSYPGFLGFALIFLLVLAPITYGLCWLGERFGVTAAAKVKAKQAEKAE